MLPLSSVSYAHTLSGYMESLDTYAPPSSDYATSLGTYKPPSSDYTTMSNPPGGEGGDTTNRYVYTSQEDIYGLY